MKRVMVVAVLIGVLSTGCGLRTTDDERLDRVMVDGQECVVVRNGLGRVEAVDCNWNHR